MQQIRNFSIIAHIDHGKSTLADRMLEITGTIEKRKMRDQVLDSMELERERGITIKMQPVRMLWHLGMSDSPKLGESDIPNYVLHLIDTPGHIDFSYEVSRALSAVEGAVLLVDSTQGVQAQTLTTLRMAQELGLVIIPAVSKIDSPLARVEEVKEEVAKHLGISTDEILGVSGKTGEGVGELLKAIVERVPSPKQLLNGFGKEIPSKTKESPFQTRALIFDFQYSDHQGVIVYVRLFDGSIKKGDKLEFAVSGRTFTALEVGTFAPAPVSTGELTAGSIGYVVTGIKEAGLARVGDTVRAQGAKIAALEGYSEPRPVVWASLYPESQDDFPKLRLGLQRLRLSDSAFSYEEESSGALGRGFRVGFLGMLHLEILTERLRREFDLELIVTTPTITYEIETKNGTRKTVYSPSQFPEYGDIARVWEPMVIADIVMPIEYVGSVMQVLFEHEAVAESTDNFSEERVIVHAVMPLRELMRNFFDRIKAVSSGYASISYELRELREADVARLDLHVAEELVPAFSRIVAKARANEEAIASVEKLYNVLPRQMFAAKIQGIALGRILASRTLPAMSKNVTQHMYGGDRTRKMKLWKKQKEGKARMQERGRVNIPEEVFMKMVRSE